MGVGSFCLPAKSSRSARPRQLGWKSSGNSLVGAIRRSARQSHYPPRPTALRHRSSLGAKARSLCLFEALPPNPVGSSGPAPRIADPERSPSRTAAVRSQGPWSIFSRQAALGTRHRLAQHLRVVCIRPPLRNIVAPPFRLQLNRAGSPGPRRPGLPASPPFFSLRAVFAPVLRTAPPRKSGLTPCDAPHPDQSHRSRPLDWCAAGFAAALRTNASDGLGLRQ